MARKEPVVVIEHEGGRLVYCWGQQSGLETIKSCLRTHPKEPVKVSQIKMTEKQYDALPEYKGDC